LILAERERERERYYHNENYWNWKWESKKTNNTVIYKTIVIMMERNMKAMSK